MNQKKMKQLLALLMAVCVNSACLHAQKATLQLMHFDKNQKMQIKLLDGKIIANEFGFNLRISITNKTDSAFICYGFKDVGCGGAGENFYNRPDIGVGSELLTPPVDIDSIWCQLDIDGKGQRLSRLIKQHISVPWDSSVAVTYQSRIIVAPKSSKTFKIPIKLHHGLKKGTYELRMLYYSGINVVNIIDEKRIMKDQKEAGAVLYQGYVESNSVKLVFK